MLMCESYTHTRARTLAHKQTRTSTHQRSQNTTRTSGMMSHTPVSPLASHRGVMRLIQLIPSLMAANSSRMDLATASHTRHVQSSTVHDLLPGSICACALHSSHCLKVSMSASLTQTSMMLFELLSVSVSRKMLQVPKEECYKSRQGRNPLPKSEGPPVMRDETLQPSDTRTDPKYDLNSHSVEGSVQVMSAIVPLEAFWEANSV